MLQWDQKYSVNIDKFDRAHEELFELVNRMSDTLSGNDTEMMIDDGENLMRFMQIHFIREEKLMNDFQTANAGEHKAVHDEVFKRFEASLEMLRTGKAGPMVEMTSFLMEWLPAHITKMDMQYGRAVYARTAKAPEAIRVPLPQGK